MIDDDFPKVINLKISKSKNEINTQSSEVHLTQNPSLKSSLCIMFYCKLILT